MNIVIIHGTPFRGVTHHMTNRFVDHLKGNHEITEYYPKDMPHFCLGCKNCFMKGEETCPHFSFVQPIWSSILAADLIVFAYPVYALRAPAAIKSLLDHLAVHWMVHRPHPTMFEKTAIIITNSVGASNASAQKDVKTSLTWLGVSKIHSCGARMMGDIFMDRMSEKHQAMLDRKMAGLARRVINIEPRKRKSLGVSLRFAFCKLQHKMVLKTEETPSLDNQYYLDKGWIKR